MSAKASPVSQERIRSIVGSGGMPIPAGDERPAQSVLSQRPKEPARRGRWAASGWPAAVGVSLTLVLAACGSTAYDNKPDGTGQPADSPANTAPASPAPDASNPQQAPTGAGADTTPPVEPSSPASVPEALAFTGTTVDGAAFDGATLAGKPVVMWFWAPWCSVCRAEAPDLVAAQALYGDKVSFVGIAGLGPVNDMADFVSQTKTGTFPHLADSDGSLWSRFGVVSQPSFVFVRADGTAETVPGGLSEAELKDRADALIAG